MRRLVPFLLLGLLTVGTVVGIALGVADQPGSTPAQFVAAALKRTAAAGTARFTYSHVTTSPDPRLRGTLGGSGAVDYRTGAARVTESSLETTVTGIGPRARSSTVPQTTELIMVGSTTYLRLGGPGVTAWVRSGLPRATRTSLGLGGALNAAVALSGVTGPEPVASVQEVGRATVGGVPTTAYRVTDVPPTLCPGQRTSDADSFDQSSSTLWLDGQGRIVEVRTVFRSDLRIPKAYRSAFPDMATGPSTTVATLRFRDFGAPVTIAAPAPDDVVHPSASGSAYASKVTVAACRR